MRKLRVLLVACSTMAVAVPAVAQNIITLAGGGSNNMPAVSANLNGPVGAGVDASGNLYIAIRYFKVFRVDRSGNLTLYAGDGYSSVDGIPATSAYLCMVGMAVDGAGNLFIADGCTLRVRRVDAATGVITTVAGNGYHNPNNSYYGGFGGDGGPATSAELNVPSSVAVDSAGNLLIADTFNGRVRRVDSATQAIT